MICDSRSYTCFARFYAIGPRGNCVSISSAEMPQPFSSFQTRHYDFTAEAPLKRPELCARVLMVLGAFARLESHIGLVFSRLLKGSGLSDFKGIAIYNAISG